MTQRTLQYLIALLAVLVLAACGPSAAEPTATPTKTAVPVQEAPATDTPTPQPPAAEVATATATPAPVESESQTDAPTAGTVNTAELNVRSGPAVTFEIVEVLNQGQQVQVLARSDDGTWVQVGRNGEAIGWASASFIDTATAAASTDTDTAAQPAPTSASVGVTNFAPATMDSPDYGAQAFLWWRPEVAERDLELMKEAGFTWVKQAFAWETVEGAGKGQFDWSNADRVVEQINRNELKLLARLSSDPELTDFWAGHPPGNADDFADFAFALASRYNCQPGARGCIQAYQIWNEPNLAREWGDNPPNPAQYAQFLQKAYAAIKRANPNAIVVSAGMAPTGDDSAIAMPDTKYYEQMYQAMNGNSNGYFDMLGVHGAGFAAPPETDPAQAASNPAFGGYRFFAFRHIEDIRQIMVNNGDADKRVVVLEFGWTSDPVNPSYKWHGADAGIDERTKALNLVGSYEWAQANWRPWIGLMSLLTMPNLDWLEDGNPRDEEQYWWAIMEPSQVNELKFRDAFIVLCLFFNEQEGQACPYFP